ncbi:MAG: hypothetical protein EB015_13235 [Methylocystaceae bacterium]|nr:hypothetical protein [Methylocystaceae bacterium]
MEQELPIRIGTASDIHDMMDIAMNASDENGFVKASQDKMLQELWSALNLHYGLMGIIGLPGQKAEGAILLRIGQLWYSEDQILEEKAIFIRPEFRAAKGGRARRLCEFSKQVADTLGMPLIIGVLSNHRTEGKVRLYERQFGKPSGAFFLYGASTVKQTHQEH